VAGKTIDRGGADPPVPANFDGYELTAGDESDHAWPAELHALAHLSDRQKDGVSRWA
jgi:hypothetical protein